MPRISGSISVGANAVSTNQAQGTIEEFITRPSYVRLAATSSATGVNATLIVGRTALCQDQLMSAANRFPIIPDDVVIEHIINRGRLIVTYRNTTAGALTVQWFIDVVPQGR
jgi:hypothetical protein